MRNLYVLPASESGLKDWILKLPEKRDSRGGITNFGHWEWFRKRCEERGIEAHTIDFWHPEKSKPDDMLLVQNHPGESLFWRLFYLAKHFRSRGGFAAFRRKFLCDNHKFFKRRVLWHWESPVATPYVYKNIDRIARSGMYNKIIIFGDETGPEFSHLGYYDVREYDIASRYFNDPKNKFLTMINANVAPHSLKEFYGERLRAVRYFSDKGCFDFYGHRWDKRPRHPFYFHYKKYVDKVWRGAVEDKLKTLSEYKFSLCFENCSYPGYISEKIYDSLAAGCIPIYLGAPDITSVVPASCFIDFKQFKNYDELYAHLTSLTEDDLRAYRKNILTFLGDASTMKGTGALVEAIIS